ncbi:polysaccharide biosynthesis protein [Aetokthonos hydrillicola Thurmond2011]|jgi:FlaA1/EpsC-like NDP-sugar epimerase|uniref:Polysaccharide biosynthesis protein n=1 Tax=Aetokthonos hydrillicola Thurmond2011 TaxID=2712845 RepID=A0AAP5IGH4_9CYAN|nr:nucleoside-diphosphate sugar epimerase/dehydratase [Aetokthonos hydrillicola]MBO3460080.1 polysaccharide biosynthesis protein [Aetokthonos hydrillicola CCALA 1050]MBW4589521.1 polysaccharide biosynthesis protein [Aetokthonos hydrillicola CCALA 1050]MDR9899817.1 polysaccharide biosynthesis protein [Aetokthonos hydrillicola Thurmond2011]
MNFLSFVSDWLTGKFLNPLLGKFLHLRNRHFFIFDTIFFSIAPLLALNVYLDGNLTLEAYKPELILVILLFLTVKLTVFWGFGFYRHYWRYADIDDLVFIAMATIAGVIIESLLFDTFYYISPLTRNQLPQSLPFLDGLISCIFIVGLRFSIGAIERVTHKPGLFHPRERVLIVGAGSAGVSLVQEIQRNPQIGLEPVGFIDDNPNKLNLRIRGILVVGDRSKIPEVVKSLHVHKVIIAMPTVSGQVIREIVDICKATGIQTSTLPGIHEILNCRVRVDSIRDVRIEDLLRREPVQTDIERVFRFLKGKKVLITGAGGSIGSELCRQIFKCCPAQIILIGHGENSVFNIQQELEQLAHIIKNDDKIQDQIPQIFTFIADIRFLHRLKYAFERFQPDVIFHAAAHKHVPLMELNPPEAITNNVIGTKNLLDLAQEYGVNNFVMISTDKAVNPTNVMGASKRVAEMLVLQAARQNGKPYVAVRFGNVLGSRGSVVPTFKKQIAVGGPVTVTHPDICRYFMTIPEAVQLVLQASVLSRGGEVLMLNMGEPVKIADLAKELIRLSGYEVNKDIEIVYTGLRPGEKLFEELFIAGEEYETTEHEKLFLVKNASQIVPQNLDIFVETLCHAAGKNDVNTILFILEQLVPGYSPKYLPNNSTEKANQKMIFVEKQNVNVLAKIEPRIV